MGYRVSLQTINIVANLTFRRVDCCYRDIFDSKKNLKDFLEFINGFKKNLISRRMNKYNSIIYKLKQILEILIIEDFDEYKIEYEYRFHDEIMELLLKLSCLLSECKVKALLLPGIENDFMTDLNLLENIVEIHPEDSCLILQPTEVYSSMNIFNAFPNFEKALNNIDQWPAIFFWGDNDDYAFVPIQCAHEVINIFRKIKYMDEPIKKLKKIGNKKEKLSYYILHLSDLHIGNNRVEISQERLKTLIEKRIKNTNHAEEIDVIITGDAVDSPQGNYESMYKSFSDEIKAFNKKEPIRLLGNHDVRKYGICLCAKRRKSLTALKDFPKIKIIEKYKTILLFFDSTNGGKLAQGKINKDQMAKMGNILDGIKGIEDYKLIAFLHHHIIPIPNPDFFTRKLFGELEERALELKDSKIFFEWLRRRNVKLVLHGHKHIPNFVKEGGINIMACGSSTGLVNLIDRDKTYISYNVIKIDLNSIVCIQLVEDILGAGEQNIRVEYIKI